MSIVNTDVENVAATSAHDAERAVLGAMILGRDDERLLPEHFHHFQHRRLFTVIADMRGEGLPVDAVTIARELKTRNWLDEAGGPPAIAGLMESVPYCDDIDTYAGIVIEASRRRQIADAASRIVRDAGAASISLDELEAGIADRFAGDGSATRPTFASLTSAQLDSADYDLRYAIEDVLVEGQPCIVAGGKKCLKTNTLVDMSLALATGGWFLQKWKASRTYRVGLMSGESGPSTIQETARRVASAKGVKLSDVRGLHWTFELPSFGKAADENKLRRWIDDNGLEVLVIDPAYLCLPIGDDAANLFKVGQFLKVLSALGERTGCTVILCHHTRKRGKGQDSYEAPELDDIAWSGFPEWARQWLLLGRRTAYEPSQEGSHKLWLTVGGSAGHSGLYGLDIEEGSQRDAGGRHWDVSIVNAREARSEASSERERQTVRKNEATVKRNAERLFAELPNHPDGVTETRWAEYVGLNSKACKPAIISLRDDKRVERCKVTAGNGQTYDGWKVAQSA